MPNKKEKKKSIIMIGPDAKGLGGVSQVIKIWKASKIFEEHDIKYISTVANSAYFLKYFDLTKSILRFIYLSFNNCRGIYIHTASRKSFYRKLIFITISVLFSKNVILHIHPSYFYTFIMKFKGIRKKFIFYILNKVVSYVVLTHEMKKKFGNLFPQKRIFVLRNPINFETMENKNSIVRENGKLLFLGWYLKVKGVFDLIDAVQIITEQGRNVKLDLYGTKNIENLKRYVKEKNNFKNISVNGWIDDNEKLNALYSSTMLILPSYSEGIPNVILEAMATKTPIVSTAVGGLKEILTDQQNALIVKAKNPDDLSKKILKLIENKKLREKIAFNAFTLAKKQFDIKIIEKTFRQIIKHEL